MKILQYLEYMCGVLGTVAVLVVSLTVSPELALICLLSLFIFYAKLE